MAEFSYVGANGRSVRHFHEDPGLHHDFTGAYNPHSVEIMLQQQINAEHPLSPPLQDSAANLSTSQYPAVSQPYSPAYADSHTGNSYSQRPMNMRRSASSQYTQTSSYQYQRTGNQHRPSRHSFGNGSHPHGLAMTRTASQHPDASFHRAAPQPNVTQPHTISPNFYPATMPPSSSPVTTQYDPNSATVASDSILNFGGANEILRRHSVEAEQESEIFGQAVTSNEHMNFLAGFSPRPRLDSLLQFTPQEQLNTICSPNSDTPTNRHVLPSPAPQLSPTISPPPTRRRRRISPALDALPDPVIGQVTLSGKFKCSLDAGCDDLTFGRQADFKRHYENVHAPDRHQYFCPIKGCSRSRHGGSGRSKGRSFNNRKDKMEEHVRTVHSQHDKEGEPEHTAKGKRARTKF